jgi:DNA modification methylase
MPDIFDLTEHEVDMNGWVRYPEDAKWRREVFDPESMRHIAKANLFMIRDIYKYVSKPGDTIMDIMSGTGSLMIAAVDPEPRNVVLIEIEEPYHKLQLSSLKKIQDTNGDKLGSIINIHSNCNDILPLPCDHIIFSPPYAKILKSKPKSESTLYIAGTTMAPKTEDGQSGDSWADYFSTNGNVGNLDKFMYNMKMTQMYQLCYQSIRPGGTLSVILKDYTLKGKRVYLSDWLNKTCHAAGFELYAWFKRYSPGTGFLRLWKSRGLEVVEDEDIVVYRKPSD